MSSRGSSLSPFAFFGGGSSDPGPGAGARFSGVAAGTGPPAARFSCVAAGPGSPRDAAGASATVAAWALAFAAAALFITSCDKVLS